MESMSPMTCFLCKKDTISLNSNLLKAIIRSNDPKFFLSIAKGADYRGQVSKRTLLLVTKDEVLYKMVIFIQGKLSPKMLVELFCSKSALEL